MSNVIIDHSHTPSQRSTANSVKLSRRLRARVKEAVNDAANNGSLQNMNKGMKVKLKGLKEPTFQHDPFSGHGRRVFPGNKDFVPGDMVERPGQSAGSGAGGSPNGEGDDDFIFEVPRELVQELLLEDLELPDLVKARLSGLTEFEPKRAGYVSTGSPNNLSLIQTSRKALARRKALNRPKRKDLEYLQEQIDLLDAKSDKTEEDEQILSDLTKRLEALRRKRSVVPFVDTVDLRFRRYEVTPKPVTKAVMFCLMDVSFSMGEHEKDLSKRFFYLLYLFLTMHYRDGVELVFIRHTQDAREVDQQEFFFGTDSGGTVASSALELMRDIIEERYPSGDWNIYGCQCSDGDDFQDDAAYCRSLLTEDLLPLVQYFVYLEVGRQERFNSPLWEAYGHIEDANFALGGAWLRNMIYHVFRKFFEAGRELAA